MDRDCNDNLLTTTLYESFLSKAIVESPDFYGEIFLKINHSLQALIAKSKENRFQRKLFGLFTIVNEEFPGYENIEDFISPHFNIFAAATFHKIFFEHLFKDTILPKPKLSYPATLATITHSVIAKNKQLSTELFRRLEPSEFFSDHKSGRTVKSEEPKETKKFGITAEEDTDEDLKNYFSLAYIPGQNKYLRDNDSEATKWLNKYNLSFVSGISSTIGYCYAGVIQIGNFSSSEIKTYLMVLCATLVARSHHSFSEALPALKKIGYDIKEMPNLKDYYEQFLTEDFKNSTAYKKFLITIEKKLEERTGSSKVVSFRKV